jgi:arylsulfatase A-like enzyme
MSKSPDILFIITDDWSAYHAGPEGCLPRVTPNLDRLRARGVSFLNAHCSAPLCAPSRAATLTGIPPWRSGLCGYNQQAYPFRENPILHDARTFIENARNHGYQTLGTGKIFHNGHEDDSVWTEKGVAPSFGPIAWDGVDRGSNGWLPHPDLPPPLNEQDQHAWDLSFGPLSAVPRHSGRKGIIRGAEGWSVNGEPWYYHDAIERDAMPDEASVRWAADRLRQPSGQPQLIAVGLNRPHTPLHVPDAYFDMLGPDLPDPPGWNGEQSAPVPPALREEGQVNTNVGYERWKRLLAAGGRDTARRWVRAYLASVAFADAQLGVLLDALEEGPGDRETIVVFVADHGYQLGERDYLFKNTLWEPSTRVPFIVSTGRINGGAKCRMPVSLLDVYPTLAELCGFDGPEPSSRIPERRIDGKSLVPWLRDPETAYPEDEGVVTVIPATSPPGPDGRANPGEQHYALRTHRYRYIRTANGEEALFDQLADPHAFHDLARSVSAEAVLGRLRRALSSQLEPSPA